MSHLVLFFFSQMIDIDDVTVVTRQLLPHKKKNNCNSLQTLRYWSKFCGYTASTHDLVFFLRLFFSLDLEKLVPLCSLKNDGPCYLLSFRNLEGYLRNYQVFSLNLPFVSQRWLKQIKNATGAALKITAHGLMASVFSIRKKQRNQQSALARPALFK